MDTPEQHRAILERIAEKAMKARGFLPEFDANALAELEAMSAPAAPSDADLRDLGDLLWCSIDNDDSLDLDQLTVAEALPDDGIKVLVAIADVDALVHDGMALDGHARHNTTTVYTPARIFPMLPEKLSTGLTSLNPDQERLAMVVEIITAADGSVQRSDIYRARVRNKAKLAYNSVGAWLAGSSAVPDAVAAVPGLAENLRLQDQVAQRMKQIRHLHGALTLETIEAEPKFEGDRVRALETRRKSRATDIIEDFMIAANGVTARYLEAKGSPSIRRVVRTPQRWNRIVELASERGFGLPHKPDPKALNEFLTREREADPLRFPDLSLAVIKLLGKGEYMADAPGGTAPGHFGLAVKDYTHSTAPNRRYTDVITQRLLKAALAGAGSPYSLGALETLAKHCTEAEDLAEKVERQVGKSAAALLLEPRLGEHFDALVTGAAAKGTWVRLLEMPVEGKLVRGFTGLDVGDKIRVQLLSVDVELGFIDFGRLGDRRQ